MQRGCDSSKISKAKGERTMTEELMKRVFVMLNLTINTIARPTTREILQPLSKVRHTLEGSRYSWHEATTWYIELLKEVRTIMYLTGISIQDMVQVLDDLFAHYE
jgi:hypothetical protein